MQFKTAMELYQLQEKLAGVVEDINARQKLLKENMTAVPDSSKKKLMEEYYNKLETLRAECLATKQKSIFADEERLREKITDLYVSVAGQEAAPSNLQVQGVSLLKDEVKKKEQQNTAINNQYYDRVKDHLNKKAF